ncbi:MAG: pyridoxal phosphate-dependent aminotransferase family protein [Flavobacteriales bacterium]|nr:pyridoxal phosphate-dependent aminotransferase family protein [Flavobacteriales bacterium]
MKPVHDFVRQSLKAREDNDALRKLSLKSDLVDFCSNDYLGFARSEELAKMIKKDIPKSGIGSTGSRLISGNSKEIEDVERYVAEYNKAEAGLIFNSGYDANLGLLSSLLKKGDTVIYDELSHASIRDGIRLGHAKAYSFAHNDVMQLKEKLNIAEGNIYVVVESVYSMDGDQAPLDEIVDLCKKFDAALIVDEAHATGLFGEKGEGLVVDFGLENDVFARMHTFGKAMGCHGAIVLGSKDLRLFLINFARSFVYTTGTPNHTVLSIKKAYDYLSVSDDRNVKTSNLVDLFKELLKGGGGVGLVESYSPIQCIIVPGNERVRTLAKNLNDAGFNVKPILYPTVQKGKERIRICIHAFNTEEEVKGLVEAIKKNL